MSRKLDRRSNRRYVRPRSDRQGLAQGTPSGLSNLAGLTSRPTVEQLERRQMLFSLAITADQVDPATGIGTSRVAFGYHLQYLARAIQFQPQPPTTVTESFNDEPIAIVGSG